MFRGASRNTGEQSPASRPLCSRALPPSGFQRGQCRMAGSGGVVRGVEVRHLTRRVERHEEDGRLLPRPSRLRQNAVRLGGEGHDDAVLGLRGSRPLGVGDLLADPRGVRPRQVHLGVVGRDCGVEPHPAVLVVDVPLHVVLGGGALDDPHVGAADEAVGDLVRVDDVRDLRDEGLQRRRDFPVDGELAVRQVDPAGTVVPGRFAEGPRQVGADCITLHVSILRIGADSDCACARDGSGKAVGTKKKYKDCWFPRQ